MTNSRPYTIIDSDTHVTEAPDLGTSRVPARLEDRVPRVEWDAEKREQACVRAPISLRFAYDEPASAPLQWPPPVTRREANC